MTSNISGVAARKPSSVAELRCYPLQVKTHSHDFFQIVLPIRGRLDIEISGRGGQVDQGAFAVIGAGERHAFAASSEKNRFLVIDLPPEGVSSSKSLDSLTQISTRGFLSLTPAARHLVGYWEQAVRMHAPACRDDYRLSVWTDLLVDTLTWEDRAVQDRQGRFLARATAFIERDYARPISIRDVAREAGVGVSRLHELFQQRLGVTPREYLSEVRLSRAQALIAAGLHSIAEIAVRTGHADQSTLTRSMRRIHGITPGAYRRAVTKTGGAGAQNIGKAAKNRRAR